MITIILGSVGALFCLFMVLLGFGIVRSNSSNAYITAKQTMVKERDRRLEEEAEKINPL